MRYDTNVRLPGHARLCVVIVTFLAASLLPLAGAAVDSSAPMFGVSTAHAETKGGDEGAAAGAEGRQTNGPDVSAVFEQQRDKVVAIRAEVQTQQPQGHPFFGPMPEQPSPRPQMGQGSGFVVDEDGFIITNHHVIDGASAITVILQNGDSYPAEIVGSDQTTDIALLEVEADRDLPAVELGTSRDIEVGEWIVAIGNPFGLDYSVTAGIISATGRNIGHGPYDDFIQTDASINPGNSGGPLFDMEGKVIGVATAIIRGGQGIGFAVPVDMVKRILPQLRETGYVSRGYIGAGIQELDEELAESFGVDEKSGVLIGSVEEGGPAEQAGVEPGDIIKRFAGERTTDVQTLLRTVARVEPGSTATAEVIRNGEERSVDIELAERPDSERAELEEPEDDEDSEARLGIKVSEVTPQAARRAGVEPGRGVLVQRVLPNSAAARTLRAGDIILEVDGQQVESVEALKSAVAERGDGEPLRFLIQRDGRTIFVALRLE